MEPESALGMHRVMGKTPRHSFFAPIGICLLCFITFKTGNKIPLTAGTMLKSTLLRWALLGFDTKPITEFAKYSAVPIMASRFFSLAKCEMLAPGVL
jgi:hypothetical protein